MEGIAEYFKRVLREVRKFYPDWFIEKAEVDVDHVHLHIVISPKYSVSRVVETMKSVTSRRLREKFPQFLRKIYWDDGGIWARDFLFLRLALMSLRYENTCGIKESRTRVKRSLNYRK